MFSKQYLFKIHLLFKKYRFIRKKCKYIKFNKKQKKKIFSPLFNEKSNKTNKTTYHLFFAVCEINPKKFLFRKICVLKLKKKVEQVKGPFQQASHITQKGLITPIRPVCCYILFIFCLNFFFAAGPANETAKLLHGET